MSAEEQLALTIVRERLQQQTGKHYWRTLEELVDSAGFQAALRQRLPRQTEWINATLDLPSRRTFLKLMGASLALAGLSGCVPKRRVERIMPYVTGPATIIPGKPLFFATAATLGGYAKGVLVESHEGRPTKIEGNPDHPASLGATDALTQAHIWDLYDPDRAQTVLRLGQVSTWGNFLQELTGILANKNLRLRLLTETVTSPTLADQIGALLARYPAAQWHQYEPVNQDNVHAGAQLAFGEVVNPVYHFEKADVILSLDADFLLTMPGSMRYAHDFIDKRRVSSGQTTMNRLYVIESAPTITGARADHRLALRAGEIESVARVIAAALGVPGVAAPQPPAHLPDAWLSALVKDLQAHTGAALVVAGAEQPPLVHALAHAMNAALKNVGTTVVYTAAVAAKPLNQGESLRQLVAALQRKAVDLLVILDGNPVYNAPVDLNFAAAMEQAPMRIHLGLYYDETGIRCHWHLPATHPLEMWGDARAYDGSISLIQPLIEPLYDGRSSYEVLAALTQQPDQGGLTMLRAFWQHHSQGDNFENAWQTALAAGVIANSALPAKAVTLQANFAAQQSAQPATPNGTDTLELIFRPDPSVWDGRFANNAWLQELPKPLSKLTWDNAALLSPTTAARLNLANGDLVELHYRERAVTAPVLILPGQPDDAVTVHLGYGRTQTGHVGTGVGFNAYRLRTADAPWFGDGLTLRKVGSGYALAQPHSNDSMAGRDLVMAATLQEYQANPTFAQTEATKAPELSLYPAYEYTGYAWGMSIDLTACIGCNACVVACQAENNIPVVGKEEVLRGHEMHWLRVDRYYSGPAKEATETHFQPVPCMQCENAPCELVCPVMATVHSDEGLNDMVYNRCVGTRYCSNNCPYKVRRFNFLQYADWETESLKLGRNPDVSVRVRGVMEKCTYCVQRITEARIAAEEADRRIDDGEIQTACQQACPTRAIRFGDINDRHAAVTQLKASPLNYALLADLNTRPRTTYLAGVRNPNPELEG